MKKAEATNKLEAETIKWVGDLICCDEQNDDDWIRELLMKYAEMNREKEKKNTQIFKQTDEKNVFLIRGTCFLSGTTAKYGLVRTRE